MIGLTKEKVSGKCCGATRSSGTTPRERWQIELCSFTTSNFRTMKSDSKSFCVMTTDLFAFIKKNNLSIAHVEFCLDETQPKVEFQVA
jgi:hypothetical protein